MAVNKRTQSILIDGFLIDATISEEHRYESETTDYPVERGANITDHNRPLPIEVTLEGIVSNTPIGDVALIRSIDDTGDLPADSALSFLKDIRDRREPISIDTELE